MWNEGKSDLVYDAFWEGRSCLSWVVIYMDVLYSFCDLLTCLHWIPPHTHQEKTIIQIGDWRSRNGKKKISFTSVFWMKKKKGDLVSGFCVFLSKLIKMPVKFYFVYESIIFKKYYLWLKWKDESVNLKSTFSGESFRMQVKRTFNCFKFCSVCLWIYKLV